MGDFERVYGAGAEFPSYSYRDSILSDMDEEAAQWSGWVSLVLLRAHIVHSKFSILLDDYGAVEAFDRIALCREEKKWDFSFVRRREGRGYRITVNPEPFAEFFRRPGKITLVRSVEDAKKYTEIVDAIIFKHVGMQCAFSGITRAKQWGRCESEASKEIFCIPSDLQDGAVGPLPTIIDALDRGEEVVVFGWEPQAVFELNAKFVVWTPDHGEVSPKDKRDYYNLLRA